MFLLVPTERFLKNWWNQMEFSFLRETLESKKCDCMDLLSIVTDEGIDIA
jgi:hypothetical protein